MSGVRLAHGGVSHHLKLRIAFLAAVAAAGVLGLACSAARAADQVYTTSIGGLALPQYIGPLEYIGERTGPDPGRSASYSYRAMGLTLEFSVLDLGANGIPDGTESPQMAERYAAAKRTLVEAAAVAGLRPVHEVSVTLGRGSSRSAREALFHVAGPIAAGTTYLWITAAHGLVIGARLDVSPGFEEDGSISHGEILAALGKAIPASPEAVLQSRAQRAAEADSALKVAIQWDPATPEQERRIWLAYLFARAAYAANATSGEPVAGEREASFEEEVRGRTIAVGTFRELNRNDARVASAYFSDIDRVEAAGFLREYVWVYLHRASWGEPPADIDLRGFDEWRAIHLLNHVPVTHGHITFRLAAK